MVTAFMADRFKDLNYILTTDIVPVGRTESTEHWGVVMISLLTNNLNQDAGGQIDDWLFKDILIFLQVH
jgi:hypothetical protein